MAYEITGAPLHHRLELDGRERLTVSGVEDVARFDETCIVMSTCVGELVVTGEGLHIGKLTLDGGELHVDGHIDSISYEEPAAGRTSLLSVRLRGWRTMSPPSCCCWGRRRCWGCWVGWSMICCGPCGGVG